MIPAISNENVHKILRPPVDPDDEWKSDLERFEKGDVTLTRRSAGESSIKAVQRLLFFLGYSTSSSGAFTIDGDFGRGTNRAVAQFRFEHNMTKRDFRQILCYDCNWRNARSNITIIPDVRLTVKTLKAMLDSAVRAIETNEIMCGSFEEAIHHLNSVHLGTGFSCRQLLERYGHLVDQAVTQLGNEQGTMIRPEWILSIMKQETGGVVRPRFEQHLLTRYNRKDPETDFVELRYRSMSFGLGQILGVNYRKVGADSARAMFVSPLEEQVLFIARFLAPLRRVISKKNPSDQDVRDLAKYYNGPGYAKHHYHERIARWFREFRSII